MTDTSAAVERVMQQAQQEARPSNMTPSEAVDFYEALAVQCSEWAETIRADITPRPDDS